MCVYAHRLFRMKTHMQSCGFGPMTLFCHPVFGDSVTSPNFLLKVTKKRCVCVCMCVCVCVCVYVCVCMCVCECVLERCACV